MGMKGYERYIEGVKSGKIVACEYIKLAVKRFQELVARPDIYFDGPCVDEAILFISNIISSVYK